MSHILHFPKIIVLLLCLIPAFMYMLPQSAIADDSTIPAEVPSEENGLINMLLVGQDRRDTDCTARADCMILCSFHPESGSITFTSFLRDLYVEIPGHEGNRLNAAYALGGTSLLKDTLEQNFSIRIDGCIEVDFSQFSQIIDALGGISIELRQDEADKINEIVPGSLTAGYTLLNGRQALAYSRIRHLDADGDFSRTRRQRKLLTSLLDSYRDAGLLKILSAVTDLLPMVSTDLSKKQILFLCVKLFPLIDNPTVSSQRIPADGTYSFCTIRNMDVLLADMEAAKKQLSNIPKKEDIPAPSVIFTEPAMIEKG